MSSIVKRAVTVYKKVDNCLVTLVLRAGTRTRRPVKRYRDKNRASGAYVKRIVQLRSDDSIGTKERQRALATPGLGFSLWYIVGKTVEPHRFCKSDEQCAAGIHFYRDKEAARNHS